jgi:hypothetical protein
LGGKTEELLFQIYMTILSENVTNSLQKSQRRIFLAIIRQKNAQKVPGKARFKNYSDGHLCPDPGRKMKVKVGHCMKFVMKSQDGDNSVKFVADLIKCFV